MSTNDDLALSLKTYLISKNLPPTSPWLIAFIASCRANTPLPALQKTAEYRLLASDITQTLDASSSGVFSSNISDVTVLERALTVPSPLPNSNNGNFTTSSGIIVQILDVQDVGTSTWNQIQKIEQIERGEMTRGREIIRSVNVDGDDGDNTTTTQVGSEGPHRLVLQDVNGQKVNAFELSKVVGINVSMGIGAKMLLKPGLVVARGMIMMETGKVDVLGGKVGVWNDQWTKDRKENLKSKIMVETAVESNDS